ncbi:MAG: YggS family pyridoxal phosphate-dependent enzyme [Nonlabens sp.]
MSSIVDNLLRFRESVEPKAKLVAVSKTKPIEDLQVAYDTGQRIFGENKVQEMAEKYEKLPKDIQWHMIGHLQRNKVKYLAPFVHLIHSIDSPRLLKEVNKQALKENRIIDCLFQVHIATEENKYGFDPAQLIEYVAQNEFKDLQNITIKGLMGMATLTDDQEQIRKEFKTLATLAEKLRDGNLLGPVHPCMELSMGMTGDYQLALEEGATMVRIGSAIFGSRSYS